MSDEAAPAEEPKARTRTVKVCFLRNYGPPDDWDLPEGAKDTLGRILRGTTLKLPETVVNELTKNRIVTRDWENAQEDIAEPQKLEDD
ncbi:hypothetical protein [Breoghania sp.]|uniref:hypothetical protein n=1 Tax=Breoghania sp. TaxID=2065378 RepID=UPI002628B376|nr:hypothetical protein [Breoghania sp.]MDJ0933733.1 hypothetical protein [Breoghania sp.]